MVEKMRFRVVRVDCQEVTLDWNETVDVIESGQWMSIQVLEDESYAFVKND
jgi:hypothetical protein